MLSYKHTDIVLTDIIILLCIISAAGIGVPLLLYNPVALFIGLVGIIGLCSYVLTVRVRATEE